MKDRVMATWLAQQYVEAMDLAGRSPVLDIVPVSSAPPFRYISRFRCRGLVKKRNGIEVADEHVVGISFPPDYLRVAPRPGAVVTWLEPVTAFHPNLAPPLACIGPIPPGMSLLRVLQQLFQMITYQRFTPREDDALNAEACRWARRHLDRFPVDERRSMLDAPVHSGIDGAAGGAP